MQFKGDSKVLADSVVVLGGGIGWTGSLALDLIVNSLPHQHVGTILSPVGSSCFYIFIILLIIF